MEKGVRFNSPTEQACPKKDDYRDFSLVTHLIGTQNFISEIPMVFSDRHILTLLQRPRARMRDQFNFERKLNRLKKNVSLKYWQSIVYYLVLKPEIAGDNLLPL
jgi:hypothetical protein